MNAAEEQLLFLLQKGIPLVPRPFAELGTTVGLTEEQARAEFASLDIYRANFKPLPNRVAGREDRMLIKLIVDAASDRVLGCHFVGPEEGWLACGETARSGRLAATGAIIAAIRGGVACPERR